ncbi:peptide ABC transporter substrate-binding protein [Rariglobus hedericola]|uniref:Peptide ABC transporter substrate-binding protein n=1 Tax=Rariglobus hedericola TaxID=2597822 RepID=A0A556QJX1_9BACT|nr:peptide ABC transporter substrate-binding protein [Rariglobus hedericola]TSJ76955.1 peptide ABC transporter substrate-binding protein [Rariglobus hedericola]
MSLRILVVLAVVLSSFTGCFKRETPVDAARATKTLLIGNGAEPADLDPHVAVLYTDYNILVALFEGLTVIDEATSKPLPGAAERWDISPDGLTYTFQLRADGLWSNGDPVTAEDFVFSIERILNPKLASEYAYMLDVLAGAADYTAGKLTDFAQVGAKALDARTLQLTLARPTPYLLSLTAHQAWFPVHRASVLKAGNPHARGTGWTRPGNLIGNGPFVLAEWKPDQHILVKKNPRHHDAATNQIEAVKFFPVADPGVDERAFRSGQVHITYDVLPDRLDAWRREDPAKLRVDPILQTFYVRFNCTRAPFTDVRVRRALGLAIDREAIAGPVMRGSRKPAYSIVPPDTAGYTSSASMPTDFEAARRLLTEAGFPGGKGFPKFEIKMNNDPINTKVFEAIQQMWRKELGIECTLATMDDRVYIDAMQTLAFDVLRSRWIGDFNDPATFTDLFTSTSGNNNTGWKNPAYDRLIEAAGREQDTAKRFELLRQAEAIVLAEAPVAPVFFGTRTYLIHPDVKGWIPALLGVHRYQTIRLEP